MDFPRLIIADERRPGKIPAGVLLAFALKRMGYKLRLFMGGVDEVSMRALSLLLGLPVTLIDPVLCASRENTRWLFQTAADSNSLNLILVNLGGRWSEDSPFKVAPECLTLSDWLDCGMVFVPYGDTSAMVTTRVVNDIIKQVDAHGKASVRALLFMGLPNPKEYELLDMGVGRKVAWSSMGYIPKMHEREFCSITQLCTEGAGDALFPLTSTAVQLINMGRQINWPLFRAFATAASNWGFQAPLCQPLEAPYPIAVITHPALGLGGNGTELLLKQLGCELIYVPLDETPSSFPSVGGIYLPHGLAYLPFAKFFSNLFLKALITKAVTGRFFLFAEGGTAPILGEKIRLYTGDEVRGFSLLPYRSIYRSGTFGAPYRRIACSLKKNPLLRGSDERVYGYGSANVVMDADAESACWELQEYPGEKKVGLDAWSKGMALATQLRLELWSCPELLKRWLERWREPHA